MGREGKASNQRGSHQDLEHYSCRRNHEQRIHVLPDIQQRDQKHRFLGIHVKSHSIPEN